MATQNVFSAEKARKLAQSLDRNWRVIDGKKIERTFNFPTFRALIDFVNTVADQAEAMDHHPDLVIKYVTLDISISTHSKKGLTKKDFVLAKKIDELFQSLDLEN